MKLNLLLLALTAILFSSCTANKRAKSFGGEVEIELPKGTKLVNAAWKESNLWYLIRPSREGEKPEVLTFQEDSSYGILEGTVIFKEQ